VTRRAVAGRARAVLAALALLAAVPRAAVPAPPPPSAVAPARAVSRPSAFDSAPVVVLDGAAYVGTNDLARLLDATRFWRADVRKLVLRAGAHHVTLTVDDPFAVVDDHTVWLRAPVRSRGGEVLAPVALLEQLPRDPALGGLVVDERRSRVVRAPRGGLVRSPAFLVDDTLTRLVFPVQRVGDVAVVARGRSHFLLRFGGAFAGALPESLPPWSLVRRIQRAPGGEGCAFALEIAPGATGFHLGRGVGPGGETVTLDLPRLRRPGLEDFALEAGPGRVRVVVLDPGHGGDDPGVQVESAVEKDLALALALALRAELARRLPGVQIVLTRADDRALSPEQRAEIANRARADLVLSLHFDAVPGTQRSGATAWCAPAGVGTPTGPVSPRAPIVLLPWREVALQRAAPARAAAEAILGELDRAGAGPVRLRERLLLPLLGVDAAGVVLDCATLSAAADRGRVADPRGVQALAAAIADGVARWTRGG
jgi:N-acetylmuramoyl-L-alanine amidase